MFDTIYVDIDGVLADYYAVVNTLDAGTTFREMVFRHKIFKDLPLMPRSFELLKLLKDYQYEWPLVKVVLLSSLGTYHETIAEEVRKQKDNWLDDRLDEVSIKYKRIYTNCGEEKSKYAKHDTLLIDDNLNNCKNFVWNEGYAMVWTPSDECFVSLKELLEIETCVQD